MPINHDLLARVEATADDWGPQGPLGNDPAHARKAEASRGTDEALGLHPISIRFTKELVRDLKAIAQLNGMGYQPLIREICQRFVDAEKKAILRDQAVRRKEALMTTANRPSCLASSWPRSKTNWPQRRAAGSSIRA